MKRRYACLDDLWAAELERRRRKYEFACWSLANIQNQNAAEAQRMWFKKLELEREALQRQSMARHDVARPAAILVEFDDLTDVSDFQGPCVS